MACVLGDPTDPFRSIDDGMLDDRQTVPPGFSQLWDLLDALHVRPTFDPACRCGRKIEALLEKYKTDESRLFARARHAYVWGKNHGHPDTPTLHEMNCWQHQVKAHLVLAQKIAEFGAREREATGWATGAVELAEDLTEQAAMRLRIPLQYLRPINDLIDDYNHMLGRDDDEDGEDAAVAPSFSMDVRRNLEAYRDNRFTRTGRIMPLPSGRPRKRGTSDADDALTALQRELPDMTIEQMRGLHSAGRPRADIAAQRQQLECAVAGLVTRGTIRKEAVAEILGCTPRSVERWITADRTPHQVAA